MNRDQAHNLIKTTFTRPFDKAGFRTFTLNLLNRIDESKASFWSNQRVKDAFKSHVQHYERLGTYTSPDKQKLDILIVHLTNESKLERARTAIRNFVADHLKTRDEKEAALVAFVSPTEKQWRFSYVKMDYATIQKDSGKIGVETRLTPARRFSYLVGEGESSHTAQSRFVGLLQDTQTDPLLAQIEEAFSVEAVTKEFFTKYAELFEQIEKALSKLTDKDKTMRDEFKAKQVNTVDFAKKLMGQIVFLYFLQKKGWLGVEKDQEWGTGPRDFLRRLANGQYGPYENFFNDVLEPLFYDTLATDRGHDAWDKQFKCRIPFLNGGLFEPPGDYDWRKTDIIFPNKLFTNNEFVEEGVTGTGVLDVFDRYNFTVNEAEPLEKEVAIDPEMLGKVFENLIEENRRKGLGSFYTPREIVHYMCQESLINYLDSSVNKDKKLVPRAEIETFVHHGEQISHYEAVDTKYRIKMPKGIQNNARLIDEKLAEITVCDPAVGSGAFPVGMMTEIVRARIALTPYFNDPHERSAYFFKRHAIQNCLYGVDIDPGAVEIAKLRLWLSLVVDEEEVEQIKPLPNLDFKILHGDSLRGIEKDLFNATLFSQLEVLKPKFFDESDKRKKAIIKGSIDTLIQRITNGNQTFDFEVFFSEVFHRKAGFQVVIGNPPYITLALGKGQKHFNQRDLEYFRSRFSEVDAYKGNTYTLFIQAGAEILSDSGVLAYIVPSTLLNATSYEKARAYLLRTSRLRSIVNIRDKVFEHAEIGGNAVFVFTKEKPHDDDEIQILEILERVGPIQFHNFASVPHSTYKNSQGHRFITDTQNLELFIKIADSNATRSLGNIANLYNGIKTGDNKRFIADIPKNKKYRPILRGRDIDRYTVNFSSKYVLFDPEVLWSNTDESKLMKTPKIIVRQTGDSLIAALDEVGYLTMDTTHLIYDTDLDILLILGILNSKLMDWYYHQLVVEEGRAFAEVKIVNLKKLPIRDGAPEGPKIASIVRELLAGKQHHTVELLNRIDHLVYRLYGLTEEEIKIVEESYRPKERKKP